MKPFFLGRKWINNQKKSNSVWYNTPHWKIIALFCCARRSPKVTLITVFVNIVAGNPSFYYVFNISLSCNINIPSFIGNPWLVLLLGNHLKPYFLFCHGFATDLNISSFSFPRLLGVTVMKLPADHKHDVIFPSMTSSFNERFIQEEKGAMKLPASLFVARGNAKLLKLYLLN